MERTRNVAILIFDDVEVLDFAGPFEVFSVTGRQKNLTPFQVYTCAEKKGPILARSQLSLNPSYTFAEAPRPDILVVPGGWGTRQQMDNPQVIAWIRSAAAQTEMVLSVCTGALLLAKAGLLEGLSATTHQAALSLLQQTAPRTTILRDRRFVDNGKIVVAAGISAGLDTSLYVVARLLGIEEAQETACYMEYPWRPYPVQEAENLA